MGSDRSLKFSSDGVSGGVDGVENVTGNDFIVSCWHRTIYYLKGDGTRAVLLDTHEQKIHSADIGYDPKNRVATCRRLHEHRGGVRAEVATSALNGQPETYSSCQYSWA